MSNQPYVGTIRIFAGTIPPSGWLFCDGSLIPIAENEVLFVLIGTTYGGDGEETFALPDLRGRLPLHMDAFNQIGTADGVVETTLASTQIPAHNHTFMATTSGATDSDPTGRVLGESASVSLYGADGPGVDMNATSLAGTGGSQPHSNLQPYTCVNYIISMFGIFPQT